MTDEQLSRLVGAMLSLNDELERIAVAIETTAASLNASTRNAAGANMNAGGVTPKSPIKVTAPKRRTATKTTLTLRSRRTFK